MELGKTQKVTIIRAVEFGFYVGDQEEQVLLPKKLAPADAKVGDVIEVFLYKDSKGRPVATTRQPKLQLGEIKRLTVVDTCKIGAFLDWGLERDLFLPFEEQTTKVKKGNSYLVRMYIDKSKRLCASMKVYHFLLHQSPYQTGDFVKGIVYDTSERFGLFVAVDEKYSALISKQESYEELEVGSVVQARVARMKEDGRLFLSTREKTPVQMKIDAKRILEVLQERGGSLSLTDKSAPEQIKKELGMSKNAFKRAVGCLYREGKVELREQEIRFKK